MDATKIAATGISSYTSYSQSTVARQKTTDSETGASAVVELGSGAAKRASAYGPTVEAMKKEAEARYENLRAMVRELIARQHGHSEPADEAGQTVTPEAIQQAQSDIASGGYYSPEATASRIIDFAKALSGGDASKFNLLKDAVAKGFADATETLGGKLPDISQNTHDLVEKGFDDWAKELGISDSSAVAAASDDKE